MRRVLICLAAISFSCGLLFAVEGDAKTCAPLATMDNPQLAIDPLFNLPKWAVDLGAKTREKPSDADVPDCPIPSDCQKLCLNDLSCTVVGCDPTVDLGTGNCRLPNGNVITVCFGGQTIHYTSCTCRCNGNGSLCGTSTTVSCQ